MGTDIIVDMSDKIARVGVGVFIFKNGTFLMGKRHNSHGADMWSVPGGHLEFGETFEQTAKREVLEETGMVIKNIRFGAVTNDLFPDDDKHYVSVWMLSDWESGVETVTEPDKYTDMTWTDFESLPQPLFLAWEQLLVSPFIDSIKRELAE